MFVEPYREPAPRPKPTPRPERDDASWFDAGIIWSMLVAVALYVAFLWSLLR
jgi:hypothetical protein